MESTDNSFDSMTEFRKEIIPRLTYTGIRDYPSVSTELRSTHVISQANHVLEILCRLTTTYPGDENLSQCVHKFTTSLSGIEKYITNDKTIANNFRTIKILHDEVNRRVGWLWRVVNNELPFYYYWSHPNKADVVDAINLSTMVIDMLEYLKTQHTSN